MSRSRKRPISHVKGTFRDVFWRRVRRIIKNRMRSETRPYTDIDFLSNLPSSKEICDDWDYNDYTFTVDNCNKRYCHKLTFFKTAEERDNACRECKKLYSRK